MDLYPTLSLSSCCLSCWIVSTTSFSHLLVMLSLVQSASNSSLIWMASTSSFLFCSAPPWNIRSQTLTLPALNTLNVYSNSTGWLACFQGELLIIYWVYNNGFLANEGIGIILVIQTLLLVYDIIRMSTQPLLLYDPLLFLKYT